MQPNDAKFLFNYLLPQVKSEQAVTQKIIAAVPLQSTHFKPHQQSMSAFELARHIIICELWFLDAVIDGEFKDVAPPPETATNCQDLVAWYAESFHSRMPQLEQLPAASLIKEINYIDLRNDPAVAYLNIAIRHSVHHRGQLSTYLRCMRAAVPAIYVESADEPFPPDDGSVVIPPAF